MNQRADINCNAIRISVYPIPLLPFPSTIQTRNKTIHYLCNLQSIVHNALQKFYKRYMHCWFDSPLTFGLSTHDRLPHLRCILKYGPYSLDEWVAVSLLVELTGQLHLQHKITVAIEVWDIQHDSHLLCIEGADSLPTWVDDKIEIQGMTNRVYIYCGKCILLPPTVKHRSSYFLTRKEALKAVQNGRYNTPNEWNINIGNNIRPFITALKMGTKVGLQEYLHNSVVLIPLSMALLFQSNTQFISLVIIEFCHQKWKTYLDNAWYKGDKYQNLTHSKLVYMNLSIPKPLYLMLLTCKGHILPPISIPNRYSLYNENSEMFTHSIECGVRLCLGLEVLLQKKSDFTNTFSMKDHLINMYTLFGGNEDFIHVYDESNITSLMGICAFWKDEHLCNPQRDVSIGEHYEKFCKHVQKHELENMFPIPNKKDIDSEKWLTVYLSPKTFKEYETKDYIKNTELQKPLNNLWNGMTKFIEARSNIEGVELMHPTECDRINHSCLKIHVHNESTSPDPKDYLKDELFMFFSNEDGNMDDSDDGSLLPLGIDEDEFHYGNDSLLLNAMVEMDDELRCTNVKDGYKRRNKSILIVDPKVLKKRVTSVNESKVQVISSLLQSLESQNGGTGPMTTLLGGMYMDNPITNMTMYD